MAWHCLTHGRENDLCRECHKADLDASRAECERLAGALLACVEDLEPNGIKGSAALHMARTALMGLNVKSSKRRSPWI